jgi:hypothetical protein
MMKGGACLFVEENQGIEKCMEVMIMKNCGYSCVSFQLADLCGIEIVEYVLYSVQIHN